VLSPLLALSVPDLSVPEDEEEPTRGAGAAVRKIHVDIEIDAKDVQPEKGRAFSLSAGARTDEGTKRPNNEDAMLLLEERGLYVVADGMGGHAGGEIASQLAIEAIASTFLQKREVAALANAPESAVELMQSFAAANEAIRAAASQRPWLQSMGTTAVAAQFCRDTGRVYVAHVGDSRCYRLRDGRLEQLTTDHTLEQLGILGRERHRLSRAIGTRGVVEVDVLVVEILDGDVFLLCSDGLTKALCDASISEVLQANVDTQEASAALIKQAIAEQATDNVTAVVIRVSAPSRRAELSDEATKTQTRIDASDPAAPSEPPAPPHSVIRERGHLPFRALTAASVRPPPPR
jgi:protein phosphatase